MNCIKKLFEKNSLFFKIMIVTVCGIFFASVMITVTAIEMSYQVYMETFCKSDKQVTERISDDIYNFYSKADNIVQTISRSWAFKSYLTLDENDVNSINSSNIIYSMNKHIENAFKGTSPQDISIVIIGTNNRLYVSGDSLLTMNPDEILDTEFAGKIKNADGKIIMDFCKSGFTSTVYDGNVMMLGKTLKYDTNDIYGYLFIMIPQRVWQDFYKDLNSDTVNRIILNENGIVTSCENPNYIGLKSDKLLDTAKKQFTDNSSYTNLAIGKDKFSIVSVYIPAMNCYLIDIINRNAILKEDIGRNIIIFSASFISLGIAVLIFILINRSTKPIYQLVNHMSKVSDENICEHINIKGGGYEVRELSNAYNKLTDNINHYIECLMEEQDKRRNAEINMLQLQINPHFIYNTLTSIKWLIMQNESEKSVEALERFSLLLRSTLKNPNELVSIQQESENLKNYIYILNLRFGDKIKSDVFVSENCKEYKMPLLLVQPFVENAFYHGFNESASGNVTVFFNMKHQNIIIEVIDNGSGMEINDVTDKSTKKDYSLGGVGIANSKERIKLLYGDDFKITINSTIGKGTCVTITFPAQK